MSLGDRQLGELTNLIKDSFRVHPNQDPVYVDIGGHLTRLAAKQHQIIFGRRGSGKSCLLVYYHRSLAKQQGVVSLYISADEVKTLPYPDLLIRLLLSIGEGLRSATNTWSGRLLRRGSVRLREEVAALRRILDEAEVSQVTQEGDTKRTGAGSIKVGRPDISVGVELGQQEGTRRTAEFTAKKIETLERHLQDYKSALSEAVKRSGFAHAAILLDDFYLIRPEWQAKVIDYLHRLVRGTDIYLKVGTVRHRTTLVQYEGRQPIGVELAQDVEPINLDRTFQDIDATKGYLSEMLDSLAEKVGLVGVCEDRFISEEGLLALTLASGGVPRDFLNIFVEAIEAAKEIGAKRLTPRTIHKAAGRVFYQTKLSSLRNDVGPDAAGLEVVFRDLMSYCLREKRKTAFLIAQDEVAVYQNEHELIQQLMDFKLVHVIEPDTSAASGRSGRYEAYTLDFALFMEPRLRKIEHVEFWKFDDQYRRRGVREAPVYSLERAQSALATGDTGSTESSIETIRADVGVEVAGTTDWDD